MKSKIFIGFLMLFLSSCYFAPTPLYVLEPVKNQGFWLWGKYYQIQRKDSLEVAIAFDRSWENYYVFKAFIKNQKRTPVLIAPENFYYQKAVFFHKKIIVERTQAIDPEQKLEKIYKQEAREIASNRTERANQALGSFLELIANLAAPEENEENDSLNDLERDVNDIKTDLEHKKKMHSINQLRRQWEHKALRKTTLPPGFEIHGDVFFPINAELNDIIIHISIADVDFSFRFKQSVKDSSD